MEKVPGAISNKSPSRAIANNTSHAGISIRAAAPPATQRVIQRLIATDDINTNDFVLLATIGSYLEHYADQDVVELKSVKASALPKGECLFIIAHGSAGKVAGQNAAQLFDFLVTKGNLPKYCPCIYLAACQSGEVSASTGQSIAAELSALLSKGGYNNTAVIGVRGETAITNIFTGVEKGSNKGGGTGKPYDDKKERQYRRELDKASGGSIESVMKNLKGSIKDRATSAFKNKDIQDFYTKLVNEPFFLPDADSMQFIVPTVLQTFIDSFDKGLPRVVEAFMSMKASRFYYFKFLTSGKQTAGMNLAKYNWSDFDQMTLELKQYENIVEENERLAAENHWTLLQTIEKAINKEIHRSAEAEENKGEKTK